jgi:hypothetical protein
MLDLWLNVFCFTVKSNGILHVFTITMRFGFSENRTLFDRILMKKYQHLQYKIYRDRVL